MATAPQIFMVEPGPFAKFWGLFQNACMAAYEDNCFGIAKGAAYSAIMSFFPVLTSLTAILVQANAQAVSHVLSRLIANVVPPGSEDLVSIQFAAPITQRPVWLLFSATLLSIWAASGAMMSMMEGFQAAYHLPSGRPFLQQRGIAILLVFSVALPIVGGSALILFGGRVENAVAHWLKLYPEGLQLQGWVALFSRLSRYVIALSAIVLGTGLLYFFAPNRRMKLRHVWPGAILATVLWLIATSGFAWYVRNIANYNVVYGSIGAVIVLLVWMYVLAIVGLLGCEFNAQRDLLRPLS